jgi:hypothetical protein
MPILADIMVWSDENSWSALTDVEVAFRNLPMNPLHAGLLAVEFEGFLYWELRSPFGWTLAPFSWCHVSSLIQRYCALHGHNIIMYVDDFLCMAQYEEAAAMSQAFLIQLLLCLGLRDKPSKCTPSCIVPFIGFLIDFPKCLVSISPKQAV